MKFRIAAVAFIFLFLLMGNQVAPAQKGLINFFFSLTCPCARRCLQSFAENQKKLISMGFNVFVISTDSKTNHDVQTKIWNQVAPRTILIFDRDLAIAKAYKIETASEFMIWSDTDKLVYSGHVQSESEDFLKMAIEDLDLNQPLRVARGKGIGCALEDPDSSISF